MSEFDDNDNIRRHVDASHAMQSGVAAKMNYDPSDTTPKHLRVGINVALRDASSLVELLIEKGVITRSEHLKAIADGMEIERKAYEAEVSAHFGKKITLG